MHSIRRSGHSALQLRHAVLFPRTTFRTFSHTPHHQRGALPVFLPASTPELSELLGVLNSKILLPWHLTPAQQKLVFRASNRAKLEAEPIEITLGEVTLPLEHINRTHDVPGQEKQFRLIMKSSTTREDWENVVRMLEGFENAKVRVKSAWAEWVVKRLGEEGYQHLILKALQRGPGSGLRLTEWGTMVEVLKAVRDKAAKAGWEQEALQKALRMAEQVVELMDEDQHLGKVSGEKDWRSHPAVVGTVLELASELAYRHKGDEEKVKTLAGRLMNALEQRNYISDEQPNDISELHKLAAQTPDSFSSYNSQLQALTVLMRQMLAMIPVWNGLSTSRTVLEDAMPMPQEAEKVQRKIWDALEASLKGLDVLTMRDEKTIGDHLRLHMAEYTRDAIKRCQDDGDE
ncbi:hypothetical protein P280DRAFT_441277 [Massarina eburnea CBS 473.64]|uniref:Uncharacterized protein n=1 Tax=Massarina eburnea CBS 473.64 TaxID=1395130 RepID=A0A6A6SJN2_9PLEO|nr:hypothetical protein P280DRAFT_441277 [Massarina eburnea CBS 473.64]